MATVYQAFSPEGSRFLVSVFPQYKNVYGTNYPVSGLYYDAATDEAAFWRFVATTYAPGGNIDVELYWMAYTASSGAVVWGATIAAITPSTDTQDVETDGMATEGTATANHGGTVGQRLHRAVVTVSSLDSLANNDVVTLRIRRIGSSGSDTMTGDAALVYVRISYSDT
jgi:hypothetical protein